MAPDPNSDRRGWPWVWIAATGLALTQPVFAVIANNPLLVARPADRGRAWLLLAVVGLGIPAACVLADWAAGLVHRHLQTAFRLVGISGLVALVVARLAAEVDVGTRAGALAVGAMVGLGAVVAMQQSTRTRQFVGFLSIVAPLAAGGFLFSDAAEVLIDGPPEAVASTSTGGAGAQGIDGNPPPIVFVIVDELPTRSIITADGAIDATRFEHLAAFAEDATWYRHFTAEAPFTQQVVPSMLTGEVPDGAEAFWVNYPESVFTLLAPEYRMVAGESVTKLCGLPECDPWPVPLPGQEPVTTAPSTGQDSTLITDVADLWWGGLDGNFDEGGLFDDFQEGDFQEGDFQEGDFQEGDVADPPVTGEADGEVDFDEEDVNFGRYLSGQIGSQPIRYREFLDAIGPTDEPSFYFLHLVLPHHPFVYDAAGNSYAVAEGPADPTTFENDTAPLAHVAERRHLQQAQYVDGLIGGIMSKLESVGLYDEAMIMVAADHGIDFVVGEHHREFSEASLAGIAYAPLLVKMPGQTVGAVDDSNVVSSDLAATLAKAAGYELPWNPDAVAIGDPAVAERGDQKRFWAFADAYDPTLESIETFSDQAQFAEVLAQVGRAASRTVDPAMAALIDQPFAPVGETPARVIIADLPASPGADGDPLGVLSGWVEDDPTASAVVVAVEGQVIAVAPVERFRNFDAYFAVDLLPLSPERPAAAADNVRVGLLDADGRVIEAQLAAG